jgi:anti-sigma-K factor RskA
MAPADDGSISLAAAEYVLGTLDEAEARRFEATLEDSSAARRELAYWEVRLGALGFALAPATPPTSVWDGIAARIADRDNAGGVEQADRAADSRPQPTLLILGRHLGLWRGLAITTSIATLVLAALLFTGAGGGLSQPSYASMIYDKPTGTGWLLTARSGSHQMSILALGHYRVPNGKVLRVWLKPAQGKPIALGKLPHSPGVSDHSLRQSRTLNAPGSGDHGFAGKRQPRRQPEA